MHFFGLRNVPPRRECGLFCGSRSLWLDRAPSGQETEGSAQKSMRLLDSPASLCSLGLPFFQSSTHRVVLFCEDVEKGAVRGNLSKLRLV